MDDEESDWLKTSLETPSKNEPENHISIDWRALPINSPVKEFAASCSIHFGGSECFEWCEDVLTKLNSTNTLEELKINREKPTSADWFVCSLLLKSGFNIQPKILGELIEKVVEEAQAGKSIIPVLGIQKARRGRPSNQIQRQQYLLNIYSKVKELTEKEGLNYTQAYNKIGEEKNKSPETIRRDFERCRITKKEQFVQRYKDGGNK